MTTPYPYPQPPSRAFLDTVEEITQTYKSLPPRPSIQELEAATSTLDTLNNVEQTKLHEISLQKPPHDVPEDLFSVLQQLKKTMLLFHTHQHSKEALHLLQLENMFITFGDLIQKASQLVSGIEPVEKVATPTQVVLSNETLSNKKEEEEKEEPHTSAFKVEKQFLSTG